MSEAELVSARGIIKGKLTRILNFVKTFDSSANINHILARKSLLPSILKEFEEVQAKIESLAKTTADKTSASLEPQVRERESFENNYFEVLAEIDTIVENRNKIQNSASRSRQEPNQIVSCYVSQVNPIYLSTAIVLVKDSNNKLQKCRLLLDVGSQGSFITKEVCKKLGLTSKSTNISISGLGQNESTVKTITTAKIKSLYNEFTLTIPLLVVAKITDPLPNFTVQLSQIKIPKNITLADPEFYIPSNILLGADIFWQLLCVGQIH
ncbi:hypothetical protein ILUMI_01394 [Ignelater luminosus]|uniref:Peptidase aspartic putative domain-containing protein n=1 Tax=Ignelater luminosus TaxID=2038154 RepID=A0A8K0GP98_IGNLU|nr:hypothetical protein ILUMI_01394 [Ignelater luminosus]